MSKRNYGSLRDHPLIFLDVDGVIATQRRIHEVYISTGKSCPPGLPQIDQLCMKILTRIVHDFDALIVVSSTWRKHPRDMFDLCQVLSDYHIPLLGMTTTSSISGSYDRDLQILDYLETHYTKQGCKIPKFIVLDDDSKDLKRVAEHLIQTDGRNGLSEEDYLAAAKLLQ